MDLAELDSYLAVVGGSVTLTADSIPGADLGPLLTEYTSGAPIVVSAAVKSPLQPSDSSITVQGTMSFLNAASLPVTAVFSLDANGNPLVALRMTLDTSSGNWTFIHAFPAMPGFKGSWNDGSLLPASDLLDSLGLTDAALILTNHAGTDSVLPAPLVVGLNVVGHCTLTALLGPISGLIGPIAQPLFVGVIHLAPPNETSPAPAPGQQPWTAPQPVPGIDVSVPLGSTPAIPGTAIALEDVCVRIYSPVDATWAAANPGYVAQAAVTASLTLPGAIGPIALTASVGPGLNTLTLLAEFDSISLSDLAALAGLTGDADLFASLPSALQEAGQALGGIGLVAAGLQLATGAGGVSLAAVYLTVGMPALNLSIAVGQLTGLLAHFTITTPFAGPSVDVQIEGTGTVAALGNGSFDITVDVTEGDSYGTLTDASLPLTALFSDLGLPAPADLTIDSMEIEIATTGVAFNATLADDPAWTLSLAGFPVTISNVVLTAADASGGAGSASIAGQLALSTDVVLTLGYDLPGDFLILASFADTTLSALLRALQLPFSAPSGFDLAFDDTSAMITEQAGVLTFTAATTVASVGVFAITVQETAGTWGFVAGLDLDVASLASLSGLSALAAFEHFTGLQDLVLVLSTITDPQFSFPDLTPMAAPGLSGQAVKLPPQAAGVAPGIVLYASLSAGASQGLQALGTWLGVPFDGSVAVTVTVAMPDPAAGSRLWFAANGVVEGVTIKAQLGAVLQAGLPVLFLAGTAATTIQGQPVVFSLSALLAENGVFVSGGYTGTLNFSFGAGPAVQLSNVGLVVGLDFEGVPSLGVAATIDAGDFDASVAVFFDSVDPAQSMFAGSVSDVTLADIATALAGPSSVPPELSAILSQVGVKGLSAFSLPAAVATALDGRDLAAIAAAFQPFAPVPSTSAQVLLVVNQPGQSWHLTDLTTMTHYSLALDGSTIAVSKEAQVYCAPVATQIGPNKFPAGFHVDAAVDLFFLQVTELRVEVLPGQGVAVDVEIAPIVVFGASFFAVTDASGTSGPTLSISSFTQTAAQQPDPARRPPHVLVSGACSLLGQTVASVYLNGSAGGFQFSIDDSVGPLVSVNINGHVNALDDMAASGTITVGANGTIDLGTLGSVSIGAQFSGSLSMAYQSQTASASVSGSITLPGLGDMALPALTLDVNGAALASLPGMIWSEIVAVFTAAVQDPAQWLQLVGAGVVQGIAGAAQIGSILASTFNQTADQVGQLMHSVEGFGADQIAAGMQAAGAGAEDVASALTGFGYPADIVNAALSIFPDHVDFSMGHVDTPEFHTDSHVDFGIDTHVDTTVLPHVDTGTHIDT